MPFRIPTRVLARPGALAELPGLIERGQHVLLVTDRGMEATPFPERTRQLLRENGSKVVMFDAVEANPRAETVDALAAQAREVGAEVVVGLGGGSVLDAAKAAAMLARNPGSCTDYEGRNRFSNPPLPFIAIPTTCGTGSEVTWVSVITRTDEQRKISVKGDGMFPAFALVDPDLLTTLPPHLVAYTGVDALTHALEAYTGRFATPFSDALAEKAIVLLLTYLRRAFRDIAGDAEARTAVMNASTLAGMAFGNADVAAVHCLSETIGGLYDVPHGLANAVLLSPVLRYHQPFTQDRLQALAALLGLESAGAVIAAVDQLVADLEIPSFSAFGIPESELPRIAEGAVANNSNEANPQPMARENYLEILRGLV